MLGAAVCSLRALSRGPSRLPLSSLPMTRTRFFLQQPPRARSPASRTSSSVSKAPVENLSHLERLKDLWRKYGVVAIGTYLTMYGTVLGSVYLAIDQGWVVTNKRTSSKSEGQADESFNLVTTTNKFVRFAEDLGIAQYLEVERVNSKTGTFLLAWIATKFTEPLRLALTIAVTPRIARFLGRAPKLPPKAARKLMTKQQPNEQAKA